MATTTFNPNEIIIEKVRSVEEYDPSSKIMSGRYTQVEEPSLKFTADSTEVTDAMGVPIAEFYKAQKGEFSFQNSIFSLDLASSQFGVDKTVASSTNKMVVPVSEDNLTVSSTSTVTLSHTPIEGSVLAVQILDTANGGGITNTYTLSTTAGEGKFTISGKVITLPSTITSGTAFVSYNVSADKAVSISKSTDGIPQVKTLHINVLFHNICDTNITYAGTIVCPRAQIDPSSIEMSLKPDGKHSATYKLQKEYCSASATLATIYVTELTDVE